VDREAERRFEQVLVAQGGAQREHHPRHVTREVAGQLGAPAIDEQVDDSDVEPQAPQGLERLGPVSHDVDDVAAAPENRRESLTRLDIPIDQEHHARHPSASPPAEGATPVPGVADTPSVTWRDWSATERRPCLRFGQPVLGHPHLTDRQFRPRDRLKRRVARAAWLLR
jgi:hypothetical protein